VIGSVPKWLLIALAGLVVLSASGITLALLRHDGTGTQAKPGTIIAFSVPTAGSYPNGITTGPDGNLWFTVDSVGDDSDRIGRITPSGSITEFFFPTVSDAKPHGNPGGITAGPDGNLWFTEQDGNQIGRITPGGAITGFSAPTDPASDSAGDLTTDLPGTFFPLILSGELFLRRTPAR
jgi:virginiamycin B lyase